MDFLTVAVQLLSEFRIPRDPNPLLKAYLKMAASMLFLAFHILEFVVSLMARWIEQVTW
jgi:hypothetical protein